ncbi:MAG TPA: hypothetical protein VHN13_09280, partial [Candidatus Tectomicrobia bacterium]|nr:hypothetical protein [Candidatus Tectomicrobia bacterium]
SVFYHELRVSGKLGLNKRFRLLMPNGGDRCRGELCGGGELARFAPGLRGDSAAVAPLPSRPWG